MKGYVCRMGKMWHTFKIWTENRQEYAQFGICSYRLEENIKLCFRILACEFWKIPVARDRSQWRVVVKKVMIRPTA